MDTHTAVIARALARTNAQPAASCTYNYVYSIPQKKCLTFHKISAILYMSGEGKRFSEGQKNFEKKVEKTLDNHPKV